MTSTEATSDYTTAKENTSMEMNIMTSSSNEEYCAMVEFWCAVVAIYIITIFGLFGNSLSIATFWNNHHTNALMTLLIALAFIDNNILILNGIMQSAPSICKYYHTGEYFMKYIWPYMWIYAWQLLDLNYMAATWIIVMLTFQRYLAVCKTHLLSKYGTVQQARIKIAFIVILSILYVLPQYFDDTVTLTNDPSKPVVVKREAKLSPAVHYVYLVGFFYLLVYVVPFGLLIFFTVCLVQTIWANRKKRETMTRSKLNEMQKTWMLLAVVIVFMICQLSSPIRRTVIAITGRPKGCHTQFFIWRRINAISNSLNSAINFVIYCLLGQGFRRRVANTLRRCTGRKKVHPQDPHDTEDGSQTVSDTQNTNL